MCGRRDRHAVALPYEKLILSEPTGDDKMSASENDDLRGRVRDAGLRGIPIPDRR